MFYICLNFPASVRITASELGPTARVQNSRDAAMQCCAGACAVAVASAIGWPLKNSNCINFQKSNLKMLLSKSNNKTE